MFKMKKKIKKLKALCEQIQNEKTPNPIENSKPESLTNYKPILKTIFQNEQWAGKLYA